MGNKGIPATGQKPPAIALAANLTYRVEGFIINMSDRDTCEQIARKLNKMAAEGYEYDGNIPLDSIEIAIIYKENDR